MMQLEAPTLHGVVDGVLQPAGSLEDVGVVRIVVALADHLHAAEAERVVHVRLALPLKNKARLIFRDACERQTRTCTSCPSHPRL